ncbi:MAG: FtsX-like permease family protein, partial [Dehalococcoidia bacterium]
MMPGVLFVSFRSALRSPRRTISVMMALALAVGLLSSTLLYVATSSRSLTAMALRPVAADFVAHGTTDRVDAAAIAADYRTQPGVVLAEPLVAADIQGLARVDGARETAAGKLFGTTSAFVAGFPFVTTVNGAFSEGGVLIAQSTASQLGLTTGDSIVIVTAGGKATLPISGILDATAAEPLFSSGDPHYEGQFAVVPDIVVMPLPLYQRSGAGIPSGNVQGKAPLDPQVYVRADRNMFASAPAAAQTALRNFGFGLERRHAGQVTFTNNDEAALKHAQKDVIGANLIFIFLGLPGVAVAGFIAFGATQVFQEETRREIGLLRARGALPRQVMLASAVSALLIGVAGSILGVGVGWSLASAAGGLGVVRTADVVATAPVALLSGLLFTVLALIVPVTFSLRRDVTAERRRVSRTAGTPVWQRYHLDAVSLVLAVLFLAITYVTGGFKPTTAEGQSISLAFYVFLGPLFLWLGLTLLLQRLLGRLLLPLLLLTARVLRLGGLGSIAMKDLVRRPAIATTTTTVVALTVAFALSVIAFTATFDHERTRDSQYVVGSDIRLSVSSAGTGGPDQVEPALRQPGVVSSSGFVRDTNALVGAQRQTVYGIDVPTFRNTAFLPDAFFANGDARATLDALARDPNGVLVSREEAAKFNIAVGDPLIIRLSRSTAGNAYAEVTLTVAGITNYFPTSSQDSDFIVNRALMLSNRPTARNDVYLVKAAHAPGQLTRLSESIRAALPSDAVIRIEHLDSATKVDESSLTSLNLLGL